MAVPNYVNYRMSVQSKMLQNVVALKEVHGAIGHEGLF